MDVVDVERALHHAFIAAEGTQLRQEDRKKASELAGLARELALAVARLPAQGELVLVDAAAGKAYASLIAGPFALGARTTRIVTIERQGRLSAAAATAARQLPPNFTVVAQTGDVADPSLWPSRPDIVVALHACGTAADTIIERAAACQARHLLLVPCCTSDDIPAAAHARDAADAMGIPKQAEVRRRFIQAMVDAERTRRLEALGFRVEVVAFVAPTVTPHNLLWRARWSGGPG